MIIPPLALIKMTIIRIASVHFHRLIVRWNFYKILSKLTFTTKATKADTNYFVVSLVEIMSTL